MQCSLPERKNINKSYKQIIYELIHINSEIATLNVLSQPSMLSKIKKKKNFLELSNPKVLKRKTSKTNVDSFTEKTLSKDASTVAAPANSMDNAAKNRKKKSGEAIGSEKEKNYKNTKNKSKNKLRSYNALAGESITKEDDFNVNNKSYGKRSTNKKSRVKGNNQSSNMDDIIVQPHEIKISQPIPLKELANLMGKAEAELIKFLFLRGLAITINEVIDLHTIELIANNFDIQIIIEEGKETTRSNNSVFNLNQETALETRAPVVAILGHVDHGKTSLIDKICETQIVKEEAGGITQVLSAYNIEWQYEGKNEKIVLLDTPGHAAFSQMRSRGAAIMDIAILVIAADDVVQPQTIESIQHIQSAQVPFIVAISKMDKDTANLNKIQEQLADYNIISEDWGGETIFVPISSITGQNIDKLLDSILLVASLQNLRASLSAPGQGVVIETQLDKSKGVAATVLVNNGTFYKGDIITSGTVMGKVRLLTNQAQKNIDKADPSQVVNIWGFSTMPPIGELVIVQENEKEARAKIKEAQLQEANLPSKYSNTSVNWIDSTLQKKVKILNLVIKASTQGSLEAVLNILQKIPQKKVILKLVSASLGEITETDVIFASTTKAIIIGFDTTMAPGAKQASNRLNILIHEHTIIYDLVDKLELEMCNLLDPEYEKHEIGLAKVKDVFELARGKVAGCIVESGKLIHNCNIQIIRNEDVIYEGELNSLKRLKEDVEEVNSGNECGVLIKQFQEWQKLDIVKAFEFNEKPPSLV
uniref:translation initiation factor 2 n=1 Tax=Stylonema alsidii TaxID=35155 RepID=UPI001FCD9689|nr:translation initiation factor 2 [Stylonema alsidii]UNJ15186.1 translation initiation factor 2 [Stylonema alsidii]